MAHVDELVTLLRRGERQHKRNRLLFGALGLGFFVVGVGLWLAGFRTGLLGMLAPVSILPALLGIAFLIWGWRTKFEGIDRIANGERVVLWDTEEIQGYGVRLSLRFEDGKIADVAIGSDDDRERVEDLIPKLYPDSRNINPMTPTFEAI